ncbi:MAG TPA: formate dehydrogenase subunit gamma [Roseobacter sp.]|nr:formate dehydrogenase subunit gamma [Roseobacter sp.]HEC71457.1 formate dehydrogenase subunit gamma [Roseobacter sp.]|tara:strand:+ start:7033 stop:8256 length:1224 start_codon:yes stop_codon:yes gene_type:complete
MSDASEDRGKRFTRYRVWGGIVAGLLAITLVWQAIELFDDDARTIPEVRWGVAQDPNGVGIIVSKSLADRTNFQRERYISGPSPDSNEALPFALNDRVLFTETPIAEPSDLLTRTWQTPDENTLNMMRPARRVIGTSSLPYVNADLLQRPFARDWRLVIADFTTHLAAISILGFSFLLALFLAVRGRIPISEGKSGRTVKRFNVLERANHWMTALSFIMLALTGIVLSVGVTLFQPFGDRVLGLAGWISTWGHTIFAPSFALGILVMAVLWLRQNLPTRLDLHWLARFGGFLSSQDSTPSARRFNAGQKLIFWSAILGGLIMVATGVSLLFPFYWLDLTGMSWAMMIHAIIGVLLIAIFIGHIYIGTVGMEGGFWAMWDGDVDVNWAAEHHDLWFQEIESEDRGQPL